MLGWIIYFVVAGAISSSNAIGRDCEGFSAGKCSPDDTTIVDGPYPFEDEETCQDACGERAECMDYSWEPGVTNKCMLYTADYRQRCSIYAGTRDAKLDVCIRKSIAFNHECDEFLLHDCDYSGGILIEEAARGSIVDAYHCQDYCEIFEGLGCNYWVFESDQTAPLKASTCKLYTLQFSSKMCNIHHGPEVPYYSTACA